MANTRFFWLPWKLRGDLAAIAGELSRWDEATGGAGIFQRRDGMNSVVYADESALSVYPGLGSYLPAGGTTVDDIRPRPLPMYAVTTDPARVPLTPTALVSSIKTRGTVTSAPGKPTVSDQPNLEVPTYPSYTYWDGAQNNAAVYRAPGTMMESPTDTVRDSRGPVRNLYVSMPVAKFVYEMVGVRSLNGGAFACAGQQQYTKNFPTWLRVGWASGTTVKQYWNYMTGAYSFFPASLVSLCPEIAYVVRRSNGSIRGLLAADVFGNMGGKGYLSAQPHQVSLPGPVTDIFKEQGPYNWGHTSNVSGIEDGDLLVWEWWMYMKPGISLGNPNINLSRTGAGTPEQTVDTFCSASIANYVGGGMAGQPLTTDGNGYPNYAPCHRTMIDNITGVEPEPLTWLTRVAPNGNGVELTFEDGVPEGTLTKVRPSRGGIELTFGGPVQLASPVDLGTPASGITVLGVTSVSDTVKQVDFARTGGPPTGEASAVVDLSAVEGLDQNEDISTYPDLDPNFLLMGGRRAIAETLLRMLETPRGSLVYAPDRGYDVRALFGDAITQRTLAQAKRAIEAECMKDERVEAVSSALEYDQASATLTVRLEVTAATGPFQLTLAATALSLTILDGGT